MEIDDPIQQIFELSRRHPTNALRLGHKGAVVALFSFYVLFEFPGPLAHDGLACDLGLAIDVSRFLILRHATRPARERERILVYIGTHWWW